MAKKILTDLNLRQNELQNVVFQHLTVAPESPREGQVYFNTNTHKFNVFENGVWVAYATVADMEAALALKLDASVFESYKSTNDAAVASKVAQSDYDTKVAALEQADVAINEALATKAVKTEVEAAIQGIENTHSTDKAALEAAIAAKVAQSDYDTKIAALEKADSDASAAIATKVAQSDYDTKVAALEKADSDASAAIAALEELVEGNKSSLDGDIDALEQAIAGIESTHATDKAALEGSIATKVAIATYEAKVEELEQADADAAQALTDYKAEMVTALAGKANNATTLAGYGIADAYTKEEVDAKVASVYRFKGSVETFDALPTEGLIEGDVYNVKATGENYAWVAPVEGESEGHWDDLGGDIDLTPYATKEEVAATYETIANVAALKEELEQAIEDVRSEAEGGAAASAHKATFVNEELTPVSGVATWTMAHTFGADAVVQIKEVATGEEVIAEVLQTNNSVVVKMNTNSAIAANTYKAVILG